MHPSGFNQATITISFFDFDNFCLLTIHDYRKEENEAVVEY